MEKSALPKRDVNEYYYITYRRRNILKEYILNIFFVISSWPRLVLEVFLRRNMGERYFTAENAVLVAIVLIVMPMYFWGGYGGFWAVLWRVAKEHVTWYLFVLAFAWFSYRRWRDVKDLPSVFELRRFSLSSGLPFDFFYSWGFNTRRIATLLEPALTLSLGLLLFWMNLPVGLLIVACSVIYALSYLGAYSLGDDFIMDKMDELICVKNLAASFKEGKDVRETDGFEFVGQRPKDPETRERVMETFWAEEEVPEVR